MFRQVNVVSQVNRLDQCFSTFLPRGTLGQQYHYSAAPLDAKIGPKVNERDDW